jgi:photosystem II stability/assembly factor-like uncharacterized protein
MKQRGQTAYYVKADIPDKGTYFRVRVGRFASTEAARTHAELMRRGNLIHDFLITGFEGPANTAFTNNAYASTDDAIAVVKKAAPVVDPPAPRTKQPAVNKNTQQTAAVVPPAPKTKQPAVNKNTQQTAAVVPPTTYASERKIDTPKPIAEKPYSASAPPVLSTPSYSPSSSSSNLPGESTGSTSTISNKTITRASNDVPRSSPVISSSGVRPTGLWESQLSLTNQTLRKVFFVSERTGWVVGDGGTILHTDNAGNTWQRQLSGVAINLTDVFFKDETTGWALGGGTKGADLRDLQNPEEMVLLHTADGGRTWERQSGINALAVYFLNAKQGWLVGNYGEVSRSDDGGKTWQKTVKAETILGTSPQSTDFVFAFTGVTFINNDEGWLIGNNYGDSVSYVGGLFHTRDGGNSWERIPLSILNRETATAGTLRDVHFTDPQHGVISAELQAGAGRKALLLRTSDGGQTWQEQPMQVEGVASVYMVDKQFGWSAGVLSSTRSGAVLSTSDGGLTWNEEYKTNAALYSVHFPSAMEGWAVGSKGTILHFTRSAKAAPINNE